MDPQWGVNAQRQPGQRQLSVWSRAATAGARAVPTSHRGNTQIWLHCPPFPSLLCNLGRMSPQDVGFPLCGEAITLSCEMGQVASLSPRNWRSKSRTSSPRGSLVLEDKYSHSKCDLFLLVPLTFKAPGPLSLLILYDLCIMWKYKAKRLEVTSSWSSLRIEDKQL